MIEAFVLKGFRSLSALRNIPLQNSSSNMIKHSDLLTCILSSNFITVLIGIVSVNYSNVSEELVIDVLDSVPK